jgi:flagellar motor switch protein FliN/FliY
MVAVAAMPSKEVRSPDAATTDLALIPEPEIHPPNAMGRIEEHRDWMLLSRLPMVLTAGVPLPKFRVKDLLGLKAGQTIPSVWLCTDDIPLRIGAVQLGWSEFEVVEKRMAIRLTRLA